MTNPGLGEFGVTATGGWVGWVIRKLCRSSVNHAFIYVGKGLVVEAQPNGAQIARATKYTKAVWSKQNLSVHQRLMLIDNALSLVGTPYNFVDIAAQLFVRLFGWKAPRWTLNRVSDPSRLQCAQLVDEVYHRSGLELFTDGRPEGLIAPSDLYDLIRKES